MIGGCRRCAPTEEIGKLGQRRPDIDETETGDGTARVVVLQPSPEDRRRLEKVVAFPEGRPRNQDQQQARFEQQGDENDPPEQGSASGLGS